MSDDKQAQPPVVSEAEWRSALEQQIAREKELTRAADKVAAQRRRLPMVRIDKAYEFQGPDGTVNLIDLFQNRRQLIVYHFMFGPDWEAGCDGCSWVVDAMTHPAHLNARDTTIVLVSRAPLDKIENYKQRMGWQHLAWYSSLGSDFNEDMGATVGGAEHHGVSVFLRSGDGVFRTYHTGDRGVEHLGSHWTWLDLTPYGRQEHWEDSPKGWPQGRPYVWNRRHDEYD